ncbi:hypothetical protein M758_5G135900 [Ceratodon purpureus]|nr:hypothetical protein M758_5G135900 [Ceratodon purpureus]
MRFKPPPLLLLFSKCRRRCLATLPTLPTQPTQPTQPTPTPNLTHHHQTKNSPKIRHPDSDPMLPKTANTHRRAHLKSCTSNPLKQNSRKRDCEAHCSPC